MRHKKTCDFVLNYILLLLLLLLSSSPLCRVFLLISLKQTMSLGNTVLQLFCCYYSWCLYFYISTFRSMCAVPNMAVFCSSLTSCFPGMLLMYFLNDFEIIPVAPIIICITFVFTSHMRCIYYYYYYYYYYYCHYGRRFLKSVLVIVGNKKQRNIILHKERIV